MVRKVNIVVTCTQRKTLAPRLQAGSLKAKTVAGRAKEWTQRLEQARGDRIAAVDLYTGDSWSVVRKILEEARKAEVQPILWICSAGYGLVRHDAALLSYAATFSRGEQDSITRSSGSESPKMQSQEWWRWLTNWSGPQSRGEKLPRSIAGLARKNKRTPILFAGSQVYLEALEQDLAEAADILEPRGLLSLVSAGTARLSGLSENLLRCDARFQGHLGGARQSLNVRLLRQLLREGSGEFDVDSLNAILGRYKLKDLPTYDRQPLKDDDECRRFIERELKADPNAKHTPLLRKLRDKECRECEQSRFRRLFEEVKERVVGAANRLPFPVQ